MNEPRSLLLLAAGLLALQLAPSQSVLSEPAKTAGKGPSAADWKKIEQITGKKVDFKAPKIKQVKVTGEVVDVWCYSSEIMGPGRGEKHHACALACGMGGVPLGIVEDGTGNLYIAAKSKKPYQGCKELLIPYVAKRVTVDGFLGERGGNRIMRIEKVTPVK